MRFHGEILSATLRNAGVLEVTYLLGRALEEGLSGHC